MAEWIEQLNSNDSKTVDEAKQKICELFSTVKEPWLVNGLYDYYITSNSVPILEILINVRDSHHDYLFNKLHESLARGTNEIKLQSLILLGHIVRKHPTWLFKITEKALFKELLKLLKTETDILLLLSALLLLIVLLPCIPSLMGPHLQEVFDIFSRLAAFNSSIPGKMGEDQLVHMQVGLYALLQRLYGMYPCNFLAYLRIHYKNKEASNIFRHTIRPMLQTVQMHPLFVTSTKDYELSTERWKEMTAHDVVVECERYSIGLKDRFAHDACLAGSGGTSFRSRSGTGTTNSITLESYQLLKNMPIEPLENDYFSPSQMMMNYIQTPPAIGNETPTAGIPVAHSHGHQHQGVGQSLLASSALHQSQEGTSPPEAAIEATPETTPIKDMRTSTRQQQHNIAHVNVARALNNFGARNRTAAVSGVNSSNTTPTHSQPSSPMRFGSKDALSAFNFATADHYHHNNQLHRSAFNQPNNNKRESLANQKLLKIMQERTQVNDGVPTVAFTQLPPTSPLRVIPSDFTIQNKRTESPISQEDEEVQSIVKKSQAKHAPLRQCDSVLQDHEHNPDCEQGSPCTSGGLHMPNSKQMASFKNNMKRLRHHSQCGHETDSVNDSTGSSPGQELQLACVTVRRANSCPEMKKNLPQSASSSVKDIMPEENEDAHEVNGHNQENGEKCVKECVDMMTQTDTIWPMPYEHLFLSIFPQNSYENNEVKPSPAPSPALFFQTEKFNYNSSYDILDKYVDVTFQYQPNDVKDPVKNLREQLHLVQQQLMFERVRRETHATKNRTLFTDVTKIKVLEEHNSALSDQVKLQERDIDSLKHRIEKYRQEEHSKNQDQLDMIVYWEDRYKLLDQELLSMEAKNEDLLRELVTEREKLAEVNTKWQQAESTLVDAEAEVNVFKEQVAAGEKGRIELEQVNCELLLAGETIIKYRERLQDITARCLSDIEMQHLTDAYHNELKTLHQQLEHKSTQLDACRCRIAELEANVQKHDDGVRLQKKLFNDVKDECHERIKAVESKYQSQLGINRALEGKILELYQQEAGRQGLHSPDTSSCHEVNASTERTTGLSPHSSPLSASLTSSEGSMAFMHPDVKDMKNLHAIMDQQSGGIKSSATDNDLNTEASTSHSSQMALTNIKSKQND